jgi:hypothetical protein
MRRKIVVVLCKIKLEKYPYQKLRTLNKKWLRIINCRDGVENQNDKKGLEGLKVQKLQSL